MMKFKSKTYLWVFFLSFFLFMLNGSVFATIQLQNTISFDLSTWSGTGDLIISSTDFCVESNATIGGITQSEQYAVTVSNNANNNPFNLLNGVDSLPVALIYQDTALASEETLTAGVSTATNKTGVIDCSSSGSNGQISLHILEENLYAAKAGTYQQTMSIVFDNGSQTSATFTLAITVPDLVNISSMADINFGSWNGNDTLSATSSFCVYRNNTIGYAISFTGDGGSSNGSSFHLSNGAQNVAYSVSFDGGTGLQSMVAGVALGGHTNHHQTSPSCAGSSNVSITLAITASTLAASLADSYVGTLTVLVSPE